MLNGGSAKTRSTQPSGPSLSILIESPCMISLRGASARIVAVRARESIFIGRR